MTNEVVIGICIVVGIAACIAYFMPSFSRAENINRRLDEIKNDSAKVRLGLSKVTFRRRNMSLMSSLSSYTVEKLNLRQYLTTRNYKEKLFQAGYRSVSSETTFLFARFASPVACALLAVFYLFGMNLADWPFAVKVFAVLGAAFIGLKLPDIVIKNAMQKRQTDVKQAWPDALDLMVICVESGQTAESAFRRVSKEIGLQSESLAEELNYTLAELSHLPDRTEAYKNLGTRTNLDEIKSTCTALVQAEKQGTPVASALRAMSAESRLMRMQAAKKKAAALGPKLTVPMILFFLPVLICIIIMPGAIDIMGWK